MSDTAIDVLFLTGVALVVAGFGLMWLPLGVVAAGLSLLALAFAAANGGVRGRLGGGK